MLFVVTVRAVLYIFGDDPNYQLLTSSEGDAQLIQEGQKKFSFL